MSLLLDALKRAANAKRQRPAEHAPSGVQQPPLSTPNALSVLDPSISEDRQGQLEVAASEKPVTKEQLPAVAINARRVARCVFDSKAPLASRLARQMLATAGALAVTASMLGLGGYAYYERRDALLRAQLDTVRSAFRERGISVSSVAEPTLPVVGEKTTVEIKTATKSQRTESRGVAKPARMQAISPATAASAPLAPDSSQPEKIITVARNDKHGQIAAALAAGYDSFHNGDSDVARIHYERVLLLDQRNRDALLGLAAIALKRGENRRAIALYRALWRTNPRDSVVVAALGSLPASGSTRERESMIKWLLHEKPHVPELHFALGTLYSGEQRWAEARVAFSEAHKRDRENPDFIFNLAVSLDHLNERAAAETLYVKALRAALRRPASFDQAAARQRLRGLRSARFGAD